jgi:hypothetical protein
VHQVDLLRDVRQVQRLFDRGVAAADDAGDLVAVEEAVAGGAGAHALAHERGLGGQAQVLRGGAGGDDQRIAGVSSAVAGERERALAEVDLVDVVEHDLGVEALGVLQEALHQLGPCTPWTSAGQLSTSVVVINWPPCAMPVISSGLQVGPGRVNGGGVTGGAGTEDQYFGVLGGHGWKNLCGKRHRSVYISGRLQKYQRCGHAGCLPDLNPWRL